METSKGNGHKRHWENEITGSEWRTMKKKTVNDGSKSTKCVLSVDDKQNTLRIQ